MVQTLLVHGDLVWKGGLGAFVALVFWIVARVRRGRARRWAANLPAALDLHSDRVVRGVLGGGAARSLTRGDEHEDHRDPELWISTPDGRIPLVGPIHVLAGSTATTERERVLHALAAGDQVIAPMVPAHDPLGVHGFPFVGATRAFTRRMMLELAGDPASAARWADIFRRYDRALDDPRTLVGLALATTT